MIYNRQVNTQTGLEARTGTLVVQLCTTERPVRSNASKLRTLARTDIPLQEQGTPAARSHTSLLFSYSRGVNRLPRLAHRGCSQRGTEARGFALALC